jgi:hypothetical protein
VIRTQRGGKPEIRNRGRIFVGISRIIISAFLLIRIRAFHIRSTENVKCEGTVEENFGNLDFRTTGVKRQSFTSL